MNITSKGRYALAAMMLMAQNTQRKGAFTVIEISERLGVSKIYLEQVFSLLRRGKLVNSTKGSQGGYTLARPADQISAADILTATITGFFDEPESTVKDAQPGIDSVLTEALFRPASKTFFDALDRAKLSVLAEEALRRDGADSFMWSI
ncbi:MAG: Rrf2 family transcriptional regulator [Oscillospiraceae bacterium]|jgi:Rrf2 family protein|nr:Rrf2 family transcriptional regulator [Oscillospiraceae bacterium]